MPGLRVDRTGIATIGAAAMVVSGVVPLDQAVAAVDAPTLVLPFGMMVVAAYLRLSGFFGLVTTRTLRLARTPTTLLAAVVIAAGVLSALFVNDVVCLVLTPLLLGLTRRLGLPAAPYLSALATASNVGSVSTLTGNPQNMLVASFSGIGYRSFLAREAPVAVVGLACVFLVVGLVYRRQLPDRLEPAGLGERFAVHRPLMIKTGLVVLAMLAGFLAGVPIALVAIAGAASTLLTRRVKPRKVYAEINWELLVLFTGLFVVIRGVERSGLSTAFLTAAAVAGLHRPAVLTVVSATVSNLVSNVPAVLLFRSIVPTVANLIVREGARGAGVHIGFLEYCRVGVPLTLITLLLGWLILVLVPL